MPHIMVKIKAGTPEDQKQQLSDAIVERLVKIVGCSRDSVSVAVEEVDPKDWKENVYDPLIQGEAGTLYKKPGYRM